METHVPDYLFKYKGINSAESLARIVDIINNSRIYLPSYEEFNDPLEGQIIDIMPVGMMGGTIRLRADEEDLYVKGIKEQYRILSLSGEHNNPQLWAHYANGYKGICLCFSTKSCFESAKQVIYGDEHVERRTLNVRDIHRLVRESLIRKQSGWEYENEWRIIQKKNKGYLYFDREELVGVIIGHNLSLELRDFLLKNVRKDLLFFQTYVGYRSCGLHIVRLGYRHIYDGRPVKRIDVYKSLEKQRYCYYKREELL